VTAEEWLAAERTASADDDEHREVAESDLDDDRGAAVPERLDDDTIHDQRDAAEVAPTDIRDVAAAEPRQRHEDVVREATAQGTVDATARARRSLAEIEARAILDAQTVDEDRGNAWDVDETDHLDAADQYETAPALDYQPAEYSR